MEKKQKQGKYCNEIKVKPNKCAIQKIETDYTDSGENSLYVITIKWTNCTKKKENKK